MPIQKNYCKYRNELLNKIISSCITLECTDDYRMHGSVSVFKFKWIDVILLIFLFVCAFLIIALIQPSPSSSYSDIPDRKMSSEEEEARRIAEMGKPVLGEHPKIEIIIEESYEFKVPFKKTSHCTLKSIL